MEQLSGLWPISDVPSQSISIYEGPEAFLRDYAAASPIQRTVFAAYWLQGEVLNGGLGQFYGNSTGVLAPEAVEACRVLNMPRLAAKLNDSMNWFGSPYPRDREARVTQLETATESGQDPFEKLDEEVAALIYDEGEGLEALAVAYVKAHSS